MRRSSTTAFVLILAVTAGAARPGAQAQSVAPAPPDDIQVPSFSRLFTGSVAHFQRLPSRDTVVWLSVGTVAAAVAHGADTDVSRTLSTSKPLHTTLKAGAFLGGTPFELGAGFATYAIGRAAHNTRLARTGADLVQAQMMAEVLTIGIKEVIRRARPAGSGFSFPSGHTTVTFASATVLQRHYGWRAGVPAYAVAAYVAASRVQNRRHYLSDVAFGAALGTMVGRTVTIGRHELAITPVAGRDRAVVLFGWIPR